MTGVERYAAEIVNSIDRLCYEGDPRAAGMEFTIVTPTRVELERKYMAIEHVAVGKFTGQLWEQVDLPLYVGSNVLLSLCNLAPVVSPSNVICFHDANNYLIPSNFSPQFRLAYRLLQPTLCRRAKMWITISRYSAEQLQRCGLANRPPDAIVGNGSEHILRADPMRSKFSSVDLPDCFVFALGSRAKNKNLGLILSLSDDLQSKGVSTVIAGGSNSRIFTGSPGISELGVIDLGRVDDNDIAYLYERALCFVFPSFYEGFGLPPIEAMACGCPVIASDSSVLPEILGNAALFCSPTDPSAWADAILQIKEKPELRARLKASGRQQAASHLWRNSAVNILDLLRDLF